MSNQSQLPRTTPEAAGIPSSAILNFLQAVEQHTHPLDAMHSFILLRHGNVVAEGWWAPYTPETPHTMFSLSKSFASTGIGFAVQEGLLTVDDPVLSFFPDDAPTNPSDNLRAMTVRHLLSMNTGHHEDTTSAVVRGDDNWAKTFLSLPVEHQPGTWFVYNTAAIYMLSAIITKLTGQSLLDYLRPRLFDPLGIANPIWETDPRGISTGGYGLHITTEAIARFGQLYLQNGVWNGTRIISEEWIAEATKPTSDNSNTQTNPDWSVGYGYQFWRCRHNAYRGDGAFGQYCIVIPEQDAVLAITSGLRDMQATLNKVWDHLLPAMQPDPLPADQHAYDELRAKLATLSLPLPTGQNSSPPMAHLSGKTFNLEQNALYLNSVALEFGNDHSTLITGTPRGYRSIQIGHDTWLKGTTDLHDFHNQPIATCGVWTADDAFELRACFHEGEFCPVLRFHYLSDRLQLEFEPNVAWGPTSVTTITGIASDSTT